MPRSLVDDAFELHAWGTSRLLDACEPLTSDHLAFEVPGAYGSVLATLRHLVEGDRFQLWAAGAGTSLIDASNMDFAQLRSSAHANAQAWRAYLTAHPDGDEVIADVDESGWRRTASVGVRLAQALQHGDEHRSQVCMALAALGLEPPDLSGWAFGAETRLIQELPPQTLT